MTLKKFEESRRYQNMITRRELKAERDMLDKKKPRSEKLVDQWFVRTVEEAGGITFKMHPLTNSGIPDRILHHSGRTCYVELKATGEACTPLQIEMHRRLHEKGIEVFVLDTKITNIYDLRKVAYTTYEGTHYRKNPHKNKNV